MTTFAHLGQTIEQNGFTITARTERDDDWRYVGVVVTVSARGVDLGTASLWGIESDAGDYLVEVANELLSDVMWGGAGTYR